MLALGLLACGPDAYRRYGIERAMIEFEVSGVQTGSETLWFDQWGAREARLTETEVRFHGGTRSTRRLALRRGDELIRVNLQSMSGARATDAELAALAERLGTRDLAASAERILTDLGGRRTGADEILGRPCEVWVVESLGSRSCLWNAIALRTESRRGSLVSTTTATRIDEAAEIPEDRFAVPPEVRFLEPSTRPSGH